MKRGLDAWVLTESSARELNLHADAMSPFSAFLSYVHSDHSWAERLAAVLAPTGVVVRSPLSGLQAADKFQHQLRESILASTHTLVLLGPTTRLSRWVDHEIELSTELRGEAPGAGLIGIILPSHEDFSRPYYDPENVPIRLHDLVQSEYAIIRKWSDTPEEILRWLEEASRRCQSARPEPSLGAAAQIYRFAWDEKLDAPRPHLDAP